MSGAAATDWGVLEPPPLAHSTALTRLWRAFMTARLMVGLVLLTLQVVAFSLGQPLNVWALTLSSGYLVVALAGRQFLRPDPPIRRLGLNWLLSMGVDLGTVALLHVLQSGSINYTPLFALPVLMGAVVGTLPVGLATAASVAVLLLGDALRVQWDTGADPSNRLLQAALSGTGLFIVALLAHQLARRLAREESLAERSRGTAQMQAQVNELVIETLSEGVLVIDVDGRIHAANPAAAAILGHGLAHAALPMALDSFPAWRPLATLAAQTFAQERSQSEEVPVAQSQGAAREVRVLTRLTPAQAAGGMGLCVMFLHDLRELEARIRTEKLAAMGRMSAAVAHEIRNPLAAITQASALLGEDLHEEGNRRLNDMVRSNAQRLARIVDDVLDMARARQQGEQRPHAGPSLDLDAAVRHMTEEWVGHNARTSVALSLGAHQTVDFDPEHLRRILVNLLDNAARYASAQERSIQVVTRVGSDQRARLHVWSDGAPLDPAVQRHLFEPFFSSESRSSGLGLFICRELCERHGAQIGYARRPLSQDGAEGNLFSIHFAPLAAPLPQ
ncbi:HAMP domain-containing sensor histidine kinase [Xenophilus arseniciresistens]|uniref:histidine kinase n=1 Tax=Xenophilus arseniciresistens TaxID=1283306 RepID=A0AAE3NE25_9BURK|nr:HAMP domain-containing sensor histidine kinase [Xenophilus arseniciresistens]MDA7417914.1 HAMP domain-containing sensor histidine kinase [Xenophilus arseniciresistens]